MENKNVIIYENSVIGPNVVIGQGTRIMSNCVINNAHLGENCLIQHGAIIGGKGFGFTSQQKIDICKSAQIDYLSEKLDCSPCHTTFEYNSDGFRGPEVSKEKPDNTIRIFLVGGSTLANAEYADEFFTTKGQMQQKIDELNLDVDVEIVNAAIASAKSWHELQLAEEKLYDFKPDIIIHYTGWNDLTAQVRDYDVHPSGDKDQTAPEVWTERTKENNANSWFENFRDAWRKKNSKFQKRKVQ